MDKSYTSDKYLSISESFYWQYVKGKLRLTGSSFHMMERVDR